LLIFLYFTPEAQQGVSIYYDSCRVSRCICTYCINSCQWVSTSCVLIAV